MKDKLKEFASSHKDDFDSVPELGHFDRFKELQKEQETQKTETIVQKETKWVLMKVAAMLILVLGVGWLFFNLGKMQVNDELVVASLEVGAINDELSEAEVFFANKVDKKRKEVLAYSGGRSSATSKIMLELEKLELQYSDLKNELLVNEESPQIVNAMIENYRLRLSLLERLLKQLKKSNTLKQKYHEQEQA